MTEEQRDNQFRLICQICFWHPWLAHRKAVLPQREALYQNYQQDLPGKELWFVWEY